MCNKVCYATKEEAKGFAKVSLKRFFKRMDYYWCDVCKEYHLTTRKNKSQKKKQ